MSAAPNIPSPEARAEVCDAAADMVEGLTRRLCEVFCLVGASGVGLNDGRAKWYRAFIDGGTALEAAVEDLRARSKAFREPPAETPAAAAPIAPVIRMRRRRAVSP